MYNKKKQLNKIRKRIKHGYMFFKSIDELKKDVANVMELSSDHFGISVEEILKKNRRPTVLLARHISVYVCINKLGLKNDDVAYFFHLTPSNTSKITKKVNSLIQSHDKSTMSALLSVVMGFTAKRKNVVCAGFKNHIKL